MTGREPSFSHQIGRLPNGVRLGRIRVHRFADQAQPGTGFHRHSNLADQVSGMTRDDCRTQDGVGALLDV